LLVVFQLKPLRHFVAGWVTNLGWKTSPHLVGGFIAESDADLDRQIDDCGHAAFRNEPPPDVALRALEVAAAYSENGLKRGKKKGATGSEDLLQGWRKDYPDLHFSTYRGLVTLKSRTRWAPVSALCDSEEWQGKSLQAWNRSGPTREMVRRLHDPKSEHDI